MNGQFGGLYEDYAEKLGRVGLRLKERLLDRAFHDTRLTLDELIELERRAYPEEWGA